MSLSSQDTYYKNHPEEEFDEESVILTLVPVTEEPTVEYPMESNNSSAKGLTPPVPPLPTSEQIRPSEKSSAKISLPAVLPPINDVSRNTLREWCRYHNLSTDGKKIEVYLRLQRHSYSKQTCYIPNTSLEAKMKPKRIKKPKTVKEEPRPQNGKRSQREEEMGIVDVLTSAQQSMCAAWGRIAMRAVQPKAVNRCPLPASVQAFLLQGSGGRWCVVHGRELPADRPGWVRLQFVAGQTWVPDSPQRMTSLFLLPACVFPPPGTEDNLLCPECVESNKKIMRKFTRESSGVMDYDMLLPNMPP